MLSTASSTSDYSKAIPLTIVTSETLAGFLKQTDATTKNWLNANHFTAAPYSFSLVPDAAGNIASLIVGARALDDVWLLSHLPFALPAGNYRLADRSMVDDFCASLSWLLGSYQFSRYKSSPVKTATLFMPSSPATTRAQQMFAAVALTRDLVNTPTEDMGPQHLAAIAEQLAAEFGGTFNEIVGDDLLRENFPAIHAVGRASHRPPRLIELRWGDPSHRRIAIVGKGVCFDTGGLNIKGAEGMRQMKKDMGGAAHALALARLIMQMKLPVSLQMLVPAVENAISGNAYRPGEIVSTRAGLKIEIGNTDAEGRVVLSDALAYAAKSKPALILDFATLTGAARVALGPELPATFANDDKWFDALAQAAAITHDPIWRMPLWQPYNEMIKSSIGDIVNTGGPQAGAVTAALFLEKFIPSGQAWIHIDVFSWNLKSRPGRPEGGEAQSLRACFQMLQTKFSG
ncbi:MAG: leucyl aminopeptidase family protein [Rhodocyclaceae bacterium]|nr:leucyl aminopeptidase family protein [Rhodocyclaceae bacterium]MCA3024856.1 leucyl aminopeptidase family protein [Rhodocyclaceae bacterium]MCA3032318.1 leucyl aminopeptidase family protein [Rhodocyclaceae bacterium]MCA3037853.1 leucyl aminopeptidase family protein [Rhodocyclaceae bacterium]MCA3045890.1 leucyl aminopeptidase family protein [Rhodocyclaceae bacterium]